MFYTLIKPHYMSRRGLQHRWKSLCRKTAHSSEVCCGTQMMLDFGCKTVVSQYLSSGNCNRLLYKIVVLFSNFLEKFFNVLMVFFTCASLFYNLCLT